MDQQITAAVKQHENIQEMLCPHLRSVALLARLLVLRDCKLSDSSYLKYPDSSQTSVLQLLHSAIAGFEEIHNTYNTIAKYLISIPDAALNACRILFCGTKEEVLHILDVPLTHIEDILNKCLELPKEIEEKWEILLLHCGQLLESCVNSLGKIEEMEKQYESKITANQKIQPLLLQLVSLTYTEKLAQGKINIIEATKCKREAAKALRDLQEQQEDWKMAIPDFPAERETLSNLIKGLSELREQCVQVMQFFQQKASVLKVSLRIQATKLVTSIRNQARLIEKGMELRILAKKITVSSIMHLSATSFVCHKILLDYITVSSEVIMPTILRLRPLASRVATDPNTQAELKRIDEFVMDGFRKLRPEDSTRAKLTDMYMAKFKEFATTLDDVLRNDPLKTNE